VEGRKLFARQVKHERKGGIPLNEKRAQLSTVCEKKERKGGIDPSDLATI
jgi:hypothetical protein